MFRPFRYTTLPTIPSKFLMKHYWPRALLLPSEMDITVWAAEKGLVQMKKPTIASRNGSAISPWKLAAPCPSVFLKAIVSSYRPNRSSTSTGGRSLARRMGGKESVNKSRARHLRGERNIPGGGEQCARLKSRAIIGSFSAPTYTGVDSGRRRKTHESTANGRPTDRKLSQAVGRSVQAIQQRRVRLRNLEF
jgi:hypothetical protein